MNKSINIAFLGDVMPGGVLHYSDNIIDNDVLSALKEYDLRVACLEAAIGDCETFDPIKMSGKMNVIYARNDDMRHIRTLGINVVTLANNHSYDLGKDGLLNTLEQLDKIGISHCGAGRNLAEARKPAVINIKGKTVAFFAACQYGSVYIGHLQKATDCEPGINPLDIDAFCNDIKNASEKYDYVIAMPHWGVEFSYLPTPEIKQWAKRMIAAGADAVIGGHPHNIQPIINYKGKPVFFSLGNFMFPDFYMKPPRLIWYPESEETRITSERLWHYPKRISRNAVSVWNGRARIGMLSSVVLGSENASSSYSYKLTYLSADNIIRFYNCNNNYFKRFRMKWMGAMIKSGAYGLLYKAYHSPYNLPRKALHFISRKAGINFDVKIEL